MAQRPVIDTLTSLRNESSAVSTINTNMAKLADAIEELVSATDLTENTMDVALDMNGQRILNLPTPVNPTDPIRVADKAMLKGDKGDKGNKGDTGGQGPQGIQGTQGVQGSVGPIGPVGPKGDTGSQGPQGTQGVKGDTGATGPQGPPVDTSNLVKYDATGGGVTVAKYTSTGSALVATNDYNDAGTNNARELHTVGTTASPSTDKGAVGIIQKVSNYGSAGVNCTYYASHVKQSAAGGNEATALFGEAVDTAGGSASSVIGVRGHGYLKTGSSGSSIGGSFTTTIGSTVTSFENAVGAEISIQNLLADAPVDYTLATMSAGVLAGNTGQFISTAGFITNPFTAKPFRNGVLITPNSVLNACFRSMATTEYGLDLMLGIQSLASIRVPNALANQAPTIDNRGAAASAAVAAGGNTLLGAGVGGLWIVTNTTNYTAAVYAGDAATGIVLLGGSPGWVAPTTSPATGQCSVAFDGTTGIRIYNGYSSPQSFKTITIAMR